VKCEKLNCTISEESCGKRYINADALDLTKRSVGAYKHVYIICVGCPVGAVNAGLVPTDYKDSKKVDHKPMVGDSR